MKVDLSIIILSYNTKELTKRCISSLLKSLPKSKNFLSEVIIVDNGSNDGSAENLKSQISNLKSSNSNISFKLITNKKNLGYPKGNNQALKIARGRYILFLNSDVIINRINFEKLTGYLDGHPEVGVMTVRVTLPDGKIDPASHRGFPTIWNSFCYFCGLEDIFKNVRFLNKIFGGYHLSHLDIMTVHQIDSPSGAFYLTRKSILKEVGGFDESYFMYGEDLDLSFRIKKSGLKVIYHPYYKVTHLKYVSGLKKKDAITRESTRRHFYNSMKIFYRKHYEKNHPYLLNKTIYLLIDMLKNIYA